MKRNSENALKRFLKRKKRITESLIVIFLIMGNVGYAQQAERSNKNSEWIFVDNRNVITHNTSKDSLINYGTMISEIVIEDGKWISGKGVGINNEMGDAISVLDNFENHGVIMGIGGSAFNQSIYALNTPSSEDHKYEINNIKNFGYIKGAGRVNYVGTGGGITNVIYYEAKTLSAKMPSIFNKGVIEGATLATPEGGAGNGINNHTDSYSQLTTDNISEIGEIDNSGVIEGKHLRGTTSYKWLPKFGNGIYVFAENSFGGINPEARIREVTNKGVIRGNSPQDSQSGNGIVVWATDSFFNAQKTAEINRIENRGIITASDTAVSVATANATTTQKKGVINTLDNFGILGGQNIIEGNVIAETNYGTYVKLKTKNIGKYSGEIEFDNNDNVVIDEITIGSGGSQRIDGVLYTIINGGKLGDIVTNTTISGNEDTYINTSNLTKNSNLIINGVGQDGALKVNVDTTLKDSVINGHETALKIEADRAFTGENIILNGGGIGIKRTDGTSVVMLGEYLEFKDVVKGDIGSNSLTLSGNSIVNGSINLKGGNDNLSISNTVQLNGKLLGGAGKDSLVLGDGSIINASVDMNKDGLIDHSDQRGILLYHTIDGFEEIEVNGQATLYETSKIVGAETINISKNNSLNLRITPTEKDANDRITGHALYGSNAVVKITKNLETGIEASTDGGAFNIITNGLGVGGVIAMSDDDGNQVTFEDYAMSGEGEDEDQVTFEDTPYIRTDSLITMAEIDENADIKIFVGEDLDKIFSPLVPMDPADPVDPTDPNKPDRPDFVSNGHYEKLDLIYKSIASSGDNINALYPTVNTSDKSMDLAGENLLLLLNDIFMANPYGYAARTSKDSMGLFNEMVLNNPFRANEGNWMIYGGLTFGGDDYDSGYKNHIKGNYYGFDDYGIDINTDSDIYGGYALAEYGLSKDTSIGFIAGGANSSTSISNGSKIDGDSIYVGGYTKTEKNNFRLIAGLGYQYGDYDTIRVAGNSYQSNKYEEEISTNGFTAYAGLTYDYAINDKWSLEPKVNLSYARISQESVEEEGALSIETDKESFNYVDTELGMDLVRNIPFEDGEGKVKLGVSYVYALDGSDNDYVTGRFQGGSDFDILVPEREKGTVKIKGSFDVEHNNGVIYSVGGGYLPSENRDEYYASVGIGFKFNNLKDFIPAKTSNTSNVKKEIKTSTVVETIADVKTETQEINNTAIINNISGFNLNSSKLTREMEKELDKAALEIQKKKLEEIKVTGHTDNTGPKAFNEKLSLKRAESAKSQLLKTLPEVEISTKGEGNNQPLESNDTLEGRRKNRRIEIQY